MNPTTSHKRTASANPEASNQPPAKAPRSTENSLMENAAESTDETPKDAPPETSKPTTLSLEYFTGNIFEAPDHSLIIHACNVQGAWGAGIAFACRSRYPQAFKRYRAYCRTAHHPTKNPVPTGTSLLIPPCETDDGIPKHWIGCLFTSYTYGMGKDPPEVILRNTEPAMKDLLRQFKEAFKDKDKVGEVRICKINSARFGVPWEYTARTLEKIKLEEGWVGKLDVWGLD